jgi:GWxTD domain-containing protein
MMPARITVFYLLSAFVLLAACSGSKKLSNKNWASIYSPDINFTYPQYRYYNFSGDSVRLYYRIKTSDFLAQGSDSTAGFKVRIGVEGLLFPSFTSRIALDSIFAEHILTATASGEVKGSNIFIPGAASSETDSVEETIEYLEGSTSFRAPAGSDYVLQLFVTDINRRASVFTFLRIDRTGRQPAGDFLPRDPETGRVLISSFTDRPDTFYLESSLHTGKAAWMRYFNRDYPLAYPPFSSAEQKSLSYFSDFAVRVGSLDSIQFETDRPGICHVQLDTLEKEGFSYFRFKADYPRLTDAGSLMESIRYLTTRQEYDRLVNSENKKEAIDDFWISLAGNQERARVLIRSYYKRVQLANHFFTSYLEGWKSDRGLIFVIFGPPAAIYRDDTSESWNYSSSSSFGSLIFTFDRVSNPFTDNDYRLRRNVNYEDPWYRAVDGWREGKVMDGNN